MQEQLPSDNITQHPQIFAGLHYSNPATRFSKIWPLKFQPPENLGVF
jgi:hypothetical protein